MKLSEKKANFVLKKNGEDLLKKGWFSIVEIGNFEGVFVKTPRALAEKIAQKIGFKKYVLKFPFYPHNFVLYAKDKTIVEDIILNSFIEGKEDE